MSITAKIYSLKKNLEACSDRSKNLEILAVSKGQSVTAIEEAFAAGIRHFGESYWQEAFPKIQALQKLPITWHFIGPIQSNKTKLIAEHMDWVHSIDREKIAKMLSLYRPPHLKPLNLCIQVNLDKEPNKAGVSLQNCQNNLIALAKTIQTLPKLCLRGLMCIPKAGKHPEEQLQGFRQLALLFKELNQQLPNKLDTLSMGMSEDYLAAVKAGSTFIRIGRAIFGAR
jgi:pyridoxal phosphate enzyme (YggS family)